MVRLTKLLESHYYVTNSWFCIVPPPVVKIIHPSQTIFAGSSPNLTCTVQFDQAVDVLLILHIQFEQVMSESELQLDNDPYMHSYTMYESIFPLNFVEITDSGNQYICTADIQSSNSSYILDTKSKEFQDVFILSVGK